MYLPVCTPFTMYSRLSTLSGAPTSQRLAGARVYEVGMGIHGEPGREQRELPESDAATVVGGLMVEGILGDGQALAPRLDAQPGQSLRISYTYYSTHL